MTVQNLPNWLTRKNSKMVRVTGEKIALQKVTLPDSLYENLPLPKYDHQELTGFKSIFVFHVKVLN